MLKRLSLLSLILTILVACQTDDETPLPTFTPDASPTPILSPTPLPPPTLTPGPTAVLPAEVDTPAEPAVIRVVQAVADLEVVDIYIDNQVIGGRFRPFSYSNTPVEIPAITTTLRIVSAGNSPTDANALHREEIAPSPNDAFILYIFGDAENIQTAIYEEDLSPLPSDAARVSIINALPSDSGITVSADVTQLAANLVFGERSTPEEIPAGEANLFFNAGTEVLLNTPITFLAQQVYTILFVETGDGLDTIVLRDAAIPQTLARWVHASFDSPPLRVFLDDEQVIEGLRYGAFSPDFMPLPSGRQTLRVESMETDEVLIEAAFTLTANATVEIVFFDRFTNLQAGQYPLDLSETFTDEARLRIVHALAGQDVLRTAIASTDITEDDTSVEAEDEVVGGTGVEILFGTASEQLSVDAGAKTYTFEAGNATEADLFFRSDEIILDEGTAYTYVVTGRQGEDALIIGTEVGAIEPTSIEVEVADSTLVRIMNGTDQTLSFEIDGEPFVEDLEPETFSDDRALVADTELELAVSNANGQTAFNQTFSARQDQPLTIMIIGDPPEFYTFNDPDEGVLVNGARIRFFNGLFDVGTVVLNYRPQPTVSNDGLPTTPQTEEPTFLNLNGLEPGATEFVDLPPGDYSLEIINIDASDRRMIDFTVEANQFYEALLRQVGDDWTISLIGRPVE